MKILFALFLFLTFPVNAEQIANSKRPVNVFQKDGRIILEAKNCSILNKQYDAIIDWSNRVGERPQETDSCFCKYHGDFSPIVSCEMDVTDVIPMSTLEIYNKETSSFGPNCFNTTLVANKILPNHRYSTKEEMAFWMNSPLCREKNIDEDPSPGDVIAIRSSSKYGADEMHGFVYISPEISFSKNSPVKHDKAALMSTDYVFNRFKVRRKCQRKDKREGKCSRSAQVYQCQQWDEYWQNFNFTETEKESIDRLDHIECVVSEHIMYNKKNYYDDFVTYNLSALLKLAEENGSQVDINQIGKANQETKMEKQEDVFWNSMVYRIHSILEQLKLKKLGL